MEVLESRSFYVLSNERKFITEIRILQNGIFSSHIEIDQK